MRHGELEAQTRQQAVIEKLEAERDELRQELGYLQECLGMNKPDTGTDKPTEIPYKETAEDITSQWGGFEADAGEGEG